jgi:dTMP kinase
VSGRFLAFEGGEGTGKSTQARRLAERCGALLTNEPGGTEIGREIRRLLLSVETRGLDARAEALLMAADRAQHVAEKVRPALESGRDVITDRYIGSSLAYQGIGRALGVDAVRSLSDFAADSLWPDLIIVMDLPFGAGQARVSAEPDRIETAGDAFHESVHQAFADLAAADPQRWSLVDASGTVDDVAGRVDALVAERLGW